jgi:hypothetical protein
MIGPPFKYSSGEKDHTRSFQCSPAKIGLTG